MFEKKTDMEKAVVISVTGQLINMLENNVINDCGVEGFEGWCEDGEVFDDSPYAEQCIELMKKAAPLIDDLTYKFLNLGY